MLNILARLSAWGDVGTSQACANINESIDHENIGLGGVCQCIGVGSAPWSLARGKLLNLLQIARLFGHSLDDFDPSDLSDAQLRSALGNSVHVANLGGACCSVAWWLRCWGAAVRLLLVALARCDC